MLREARLRRAVSLPIANPFGRSSIPRGDGLHWGDEAGAGFQQRLAEIDVIQQLRFGGTRGQILDLGYLLCLDTGCCYGGLLTALDLNARTYWQTPADGRVVTTGRLPTHGEA